MSASQLAYLILLLVAGTFVCVAAYWDVKEKRIPNRFTLPMFYAGCVYQLVLSLIDGWQHLGSGLAGFAIGFGILFVLWFVGSGGGGDVKLMGALGVWLGGWMTLQVLLATLCIIVCLVVGRRVIGMAFRRIPAVAAGTAPSRTLVSMRADQKVDRRLMAFAAPVAVATWAVLLLSPWLDSKTPSGRTTIEKTMVQTQP